MYFFLFLKLSLDLLLTLQLHSTKISKKNSNLKKPKKEISSTLDQFDIKDIEEYLKNKKSDI